MWTTLTDPLNGNLIDQQGYVWFLHIRIHAYPTYPLTNLKPGVTMHPTTILCEPNNPSNTIFMYILLKIIYFTDIISFVHTKTTPSMFKVFTYADFLSFVQIGEYFFWYGKEIRKCFHVFRRTWNWSYWGYLL